MKHWILASLALVAFASFATAGENKKFVVLMAGRPSHGPGQHEHNAGVLLLKKCLTENAPQVTVKEYLNGQWPAAEDLAKADTLLIYSDGGGGHPALAMDRLAQLDKHMKRGCGIVCIHYAVEVPKDKGGPQFVDWLGGYFETHWSVNPHWKADFKTLPKHPITSGVKPFATQDEWYFHMRFRPKMANVTAILSDVPPESTIGRPDGPHSGNPTVREEVKNKVPQVVAWAVEREDGGRGFGFTGGHFHTGWGNPDQRKLVLNAILWTAKAAVPDQGVASSISPADLEANLDPKPKK